MASELEPKAADFRRELLEHDQQAARAMAQTYREAQAAIQIEINRVTAEIERALAADEDVRPGWLWRNDRYRSLLDQSERQLTEFTRQAGQQLASSTRTAAEQGSSHAGELTAASLGPPPPSATISFATLPDEALLELTANTQPNTPLGRLLAEFPGRSSEQVRSTLIEGLALGQHPTVIARNIASGFNGGLTRALLISRTEILRSYRESSRQTYLANEHLVDSWIWRAALTPNTCAVCWAMHGSEHPLDEQMGSHPACRCTMVPKTKTWEELGFDVPKRHERSARITSGPEEFRKLDADTQSRILGPARYDGYKAGEIDLPELVKVNDSGDWGVTRTPKSLREMALAGSADRHRSPTEPEGQHIRRKT